MRRTALALALALAGAACTGSGSGGADRSPGPRADPSTSLRFAAVGDTGDGSARAGRVAEAIARAHAAEPIDLLLLLGDLIYPAGDPAQYREKFARPYAPVLEAGIETAAVLGNHDVRTDVAGMMEAFGIPARFYTFARGPVQFFALDSNAGRILEAQRPWLRRELDRSAAPWKVAFLHAPPYSSGEHGSSVVLQQTFVDLFERHGVHLVLAGHDHDYERTEPIGGVTYVVSGGGCCPRGVGRSDFTERASSALHFVLVSVTPARMRIEAIAADGTVIDAAHIEREDAAAA